jgi:hypothetical protein
VKHLSDFQQLLPLENDADVVRRIIGTWQPTSCELEEKSQEQALFAWLKSKLPGVAMKSQYGIAWGIADIVIQDQHVIELKLGFRATSVADFDRCLGQLWRYKEKWSTPRDDCRVWLVTVGESEAEFRHLMAKWIKELNGHFFTTQFEWLEKLP